MTGEKPSEPAVDTPSAKADEDVHLTPPTLFMPQPANAFGMSLPGIYPPPHLDAQSLMAMQQQMEQAAKLQPPPGSPAVSCLDPNKFFPNPAPRMTVSSPTMHGQQGHFLLPMQGCLSPNTLPADWQQQYLSQLASLQSMTMGYLSPAGHPNTPGSQHPLLWGDLRVPTPHMMAMQPPRSPYLTPTHRVVSAPLDKQVDQEKGKLVSGVTDVEDEIKYSPPSAATNADWLNLAANNPNSYPLPALSPFGTPTILTPNGGDPHADPAGAMTAADGNEGSKSAGRLVDNVLHAKSLTEQMLREFTVDRAADIFKTALALLGRPQVAPGEIEIADAHVFAPETAASGALPSVKLVHPDEFKNPSTFLKIYGDPLCFTKNGPLPKKGRNGNWECPKCTNVNFPRRFRCNMCSTARDADGDWVVSEYARQVYERYLFIYKNQATRSPVNNAGGGSQGENTGRQQNASSTMSGPQDLIIPAPNTAGLLGGYPPAPAHRGQIGQSNFGGGHQQGYRNGSNNRRHHHGGRNQGQQQQRYPHYNNDPRGPGYDAQSRGSFSTGQNASDMASKHQRGNQYAQY